MTIKNRFPDVAPVLNLDFANTKRLDPRITFTRASTGTYVDEFGIVRTAAANQARFDHDSAGNSLGLLIEESRTNSFTYSEEFDNAAWSKSNATVTANVVAALDGTTTAELLSSSAAGTATINRAFTRNNPAFSVFIKAGSSSTANIKIQSDVVGRNVSYNANLSTGVLTAGTGNTGNLTGWTEYKSITALGNGWYRVFIGFLSSTITVNSTYSISPSLNGTAAAAGESIYIWGAQLEAGSFPTSYIPTTSSTATRSADVASMTGTNFSNWYNHNEGTLLQSFVPRGSNVTYAGRLYLSSTDYTGSYIDPITRIVHMYRTSAAENVLLKTGTYVNTAVNLGMAYDTASFSGCYNGTTVQTASSVTGTQSTLTQLLVGSGTQHISRLAYYDRRLTDAQLQALTL